MEIKYIYNMRHVGFIFVSIWISERGPLENVWVTGNFALE